MKQRRSPVPRTDRRDPPGWLGRIAGLVWVTHPLPSALYAIAVGLFAAIAARASSRPLDGWTLARALLAVYCLRAAVAGVNDYCNRYLDAAWRRTGPIIRGLIRPWQAIAVPIGTTAIMLVALATLGMLPLLLGCVILVLGLLCVLYFRSSPVGDALYALSFPLIPLLAWSIFGRWQPFLFWLFPLGAAMGVALRVAGSLPDVEGQILMGLGDLPHLLGPLRSKLVAWGTLPALLVFIWMLSLMRVLSTQQPWLVVATAAALLSVAPATLLYVARPTSGSLRVGFLVQAIGSVVFAAAWLAAVAW